MLIPWFLSGLSERICCFLSCTLDVIVVRRQFVCTALAWLWAACASGSTEYFLFLPWKRKCKEGRVERIEEMISCMDWPWDQWLSGRRCVFTFNYSTCELLGLNLCDDDDDELALVSSSRSLTLMNGPNLCKIGPCEMLQTSSSSSWLVIKQKHRDALNIHCYLSGSCMPVCLRRPLRWTD